MRPARPACAACSLDTRLTSLEQRLAGLDPDARQVVSQSVATLIAAGEGPPGQQQGGSGGDSGGGGGRL